MVKTMITFLNIIFNQIIIIQKIFDYLSGIIAVLKNIVIHIVNLTVFL